MRSFICAILFLASGIVAQNCGPMYGNTVCKPNKCCSQYGWCDVGKAYCDPATCQKDFSGKNSPCAANVPSKHTTTTKGRTKTSARPTFPTAVPEIDVCGSAQGGVTCPGAGANGYFYRCCSSAGHCGPKNDIQDQDLYCGQGCQKGYGKCNSMSSPPEPTATPGTANEGETCGPIVNRMCADGLCCSGSNFCGKTADFCGAANWCQPNYGHCS